MWRDDEFYGPKWQTWEGPDWPTDDGAPDRFEGTLTRHPVSWTGKDGETKKVWRYVPFRAVVPKPSTSVREPRTVADHKRAASGDRE